MKGWWLSAREMAAGDSQPWKSASSSIVVPSAIDEIEVAAARTVEALKSRLKKIEKPVKGEIKVIISERHAVRIASLFVGVLAVGIARADSRLYVQSPATYAPEATFSQKAKDECAVEVKLADYVRSHASKQFSEVVPIKDISEAGQGMVLSLAIFEIYGAGGGGWSGFKSITAEAKLLQGGTVLGTFKDKNSSKGGVLGPFQGTCAILDRATGHFAEDVAEWLAKMVPTTAPAASVKQ